MYDSKTFLNSEPGFKEKQKSGILSLDILFLLSVFLPFLITFFFTSSLFAQSIGTWKSYTSQSTVLDLVQDNQGGLWASTGGGLFYVDNGEITLSLTPTEGMYRINPETIYFDKEKEVLWLGYSDGMFERYHPDSRHFQTFNDIARAIRFSPRKINQFTMTDEGLLIATDFGLVLFDPEREVTIDTYSNLGTFPSGSRVNAVAVQENRIFAVTPDGAAMAEMDQGDLVVPDEWTTYGTEAGLTGNPTHIVSFQGSVHLLMGHEIYRFTEGSWIQTAIFDGEEVNHIKISENGDYLLGWSEKKALLYPSPADGLNFTLSAGNPINTGLVDESLGFLFTGATDQGIYAINLQNGEIEEQYLPAGPYMNSFSGLIVKNGILASGSNSLLGRRGRGSSQSGYYLYRDGNWENYNDLTDSVLQAYSFNSVYTSAATDDYFFFGSYGRGIAQHHIATNEVTVWNTENSILDGWRPGSSFFIASGLTTDTRGNVYVISRNNVENALFRFEPESREWSVIPRYQGLSTNEIYKRVTVDSHGQIWIPIVNERMDGRGLLVKKVDDENNVKGVILREDAGRGNLPHPMVNTVVQDRRGEIWIGTSRGIARFSFPQRVVDGQSSDRQASMLINADEKADAPFLLRTSNITSIAVNSANQKWVGTDGEGLWLLNEEGGRFRAVKNFTTDNSPLISNSIFSLAYDDVTGQIFIATDLGLVSYTDVVRGSVAKMSDLFIYPNPFSYQRETNERIIIDELSSQTTIRILTVDGRLVRRLESRGGRVEWDVRDFQGNKVATGVYVIVAVDTQNEQKGVGKVAVIR